MQCINLNDLHISRENSIQAVWLRNYMVIETIHISLDPLPILALAFSVIVDIHLATTSNSGYDEVIQGMMR